MRLLLAIIIAAGVSGCASADESVGATLDNYSTRGNSNPYTGQRGSRSGYASGFKPLSSWGSDNNWDARE